jgi:pSer/pThr/pTyr-binding forkhead associated (FHA) protein
VEGPKVQRFSNIEMGRQPREVARLRVLKGIDRGIVFVINDSSIVLGRGEEAHARVSDLKTSRVHARLDFTKDGWLLSDQGSANGIYFQGEFVRKCTLRSGDHFTIGETIVEFIASSENTRFLTAPLRNSQEVDEMDRALAYQREKVKSFGSTPSAAPQGAQKPKKNTMLIVAALAALYFMMPEEEQKPQKPKKKIEKKEESARGLAADPVDRESSKTAEQYYRQGFREYREKNYLRAKAQFELALQVNPNHELAKHYLYVSEQDSINEVKKLIRSAQKSRATGKLKESKGYFEAAMRLMYNDQSNPDFIECEEAVKKITEELERARQ